MIGVENGHVARLELVARFERREESTPGMLATKGKASAAWAASTSSRGKTSMIEKSASQQLEGKGAR